MFRAMQLSELAELSKRVAETSKRLRKVELLADLLRRVPAHEARLCVAYCCGQIPQQKLGVGHSVLREMSVSPASEAQLSLTEVDAFFQRMADARGVGSKRNKVELLSMLFARSTPSEQNFVACLILGELRQGALEGVLLDAVAQASGVPASELRRAVLFAGGLRPVAEAALAQGSVGLAQFQLQLMQPLSPMLAQPAGELSDVLTKLGRGFAEYKIDGARIQVHKQGSEVRVFTRALNDVTASVPDLVERVQALPSERLVLDGEAIALSKDGTPLPFVTTMKRFGRKLDVEDQRRVLPLSCYFFDCLHHEGVDLVDSPYVERVAVLDSALPRTLQVPRVEIEGEVALQCFFEQALAAGHEGVMAKVADSAYEAGRRGAGWFKLKPVHSLDLVVLGAEWGSGRRRGTLSNLHLGAREGDGFVMLGKTFKGLTDELLTFQTEQLLQRETARHANVVCVRPELVVEIAFDGVTESSQYPGGLSLRFARVKGYRLDKLASQADTLDTVRELYHRGHRARSAGGSVEPPTRGTRAGDQGQPAG